MGCRSGGYLIFTVTALGIGLIESLCWRFIPTHSSTSSDPFTRLGDGMHRRLSRARTTNFITFARCNVSNFRDWWHAQSNRERVESVILRPLELFNTIWLIYIVLAQTFGAYRNCNCMNSIWGSHGGYMDFQNVWFYRANGVQYYWGFGTGLSGIVMVISFTYIVIQWCVQSHLSTVSYDNARNGLLLTRRYKRFMFPLSNLFSKPLGALKLWWFKHVVRRGHYIERGRRSLIWDYHTNNTTSTTTTPYTQQFSPIPLILSPSSHSIPDLPNHLHHHRSSSTGDDTSDPERLQRHRRASSRVSNPDNEGLGLLRGRLGSGGSAVIDDDESATNTRFGYGLRPINSPEGVYNTSRGSPRSSFDEGVSPTRPRNLGP